MVKSDVTSLPIFICNSTYTMKNYIMHMQNFSAITLLEDVIVT